MQTLYNFVQNEKNFEPKTVRVLVRSKKTVLQYKYLEKICKCKTAVDASVHRKKRKEKWRTLSKAFRKKRSAIASIDRAKLEVRRLCEGVRRSKMRIKKRNRQIYKINSENNRQEDRKNQIRGKAENRRQPVIVLLFVIILLLTGCGGSGSSDMLSGRDMEKEAEQKDKESMQKVVLEQEGKYNRHFRNGLYFEDLSKPQQELNELFNKHLEKELKRFLQEQVPIYKDIPFVLQTEVEYVNADAKAYMSGEKKAEEIIDNPDSMMKLKIGWYFFKIFDGENGEDVDFVYTHLRNLLNQEWVDKYIHQGVEEFEAIIKGYDPEVLERHSKEEITAAKPIEKLLKEEHQTLDLILLKTPYYVTKNFEDNYDCEGGIWDSDNNVLKEALEKKYNTEFLPMYSGFNAYKNNPDLMFEGYFAEEDVVTDHFQSMMYQHLLNKHIRKMVDEAALSDRVLFFVNTESKHRSSDGAGSDEEPYDFGENFDEDYFLREGYREVVDITFIYLDDEAVDVEDTKWATVSLLKKKFFYPLHEKISFEHRDTTLQDGTKAEGNIKNGYVYIYNMNEADRKVVVDLFRKNALTERAKRPRTEKIADVFSLQYVTRAETQGFHFLDIFGKNKTRITLNRKDIIDDYNEAVEKGLYPEKK